MEKNVCYYSKNDNEFVFQELDDLRVNQNYMYIHLIKDDKKYMNFFFLFCSVLDGIPIIRNIF